MSYTHGTCVHLHDSVSVPGLCSCLHTTHVLVNLVAKQVVPNGCAVQ